jgi:hypothetical protein
MKTLIWALHVCGTTNVSASDVHFVRIIVDTIARTQEESRNLCLPRNPHSTWQVARSYGWDVVQLTAERVS